MMLRALLVLSSLLAGCALPPPHAERFSFAVIGDTPYSDAEEQRFLQMLDDLNAADLRFVVHVGDFKAGSNSPCTDALFETRRQQFGRIRHPLVYLPGDNEWVDCRRASNGAMNPLERLTKLRLVFHPNREHPDGERSFAPSQNLTGCVLEVAGVCRCFGYPEIGYWQSAGAAFAVLNLQGSNDNAGFDAASDRERSCRTRANHLALERASGLAAAAHGGLVVIAHANPLVESKDQAYQPFLDQLTQVAIRHARPILFIHGDTHVFRVDQPFKDAAGQALRNVTRLEVFGSPMTGWVRVNVDQNDPVLFRIEIGQTYP